MSSGSSLSSIKAFSKKVKFYNSSIASYTLASIISELSSTCNQFSAIALISYFVKYPSLNSDHFVP